MNKFEMKDMEATNKILAIHFLRKMAVRTLIISKKEYITKVVKKFNMDLSKAVMTPMAQHFELSKLDSPKTKDEISIMKKNSYANVVGSLMYVMICTRPDIVYAVSLVSRHMENPRKLH